jgi:hypothetical protein
MIRRKRFVNGALEYEFHEKFMEKYMKEYSFICLIED